MLPAFKKIGLAVAIGAALTAAPVFAQSSNLVVSFKPEAGMPQAKLLQASDGNIYGTSEMGGIYGQGSVFAITPAGAVFTVHSFNRTDGSNPVGELVQASDG